MTTPNDKPCRNCGQLKSDHTPVTQWCSQGSGEFYEPLEATAAPVANKCKTCEDRREIFHLGNGQYEPCPDCSPAPVATERPTPETDVRTFTITLAHDILWQDMTGDAYVEADFARSLERQRDELAERLAESEAGRVQAEKERDEANSRFERELEKLKVLFDGIEDSDPINDKLEKWQQNIEATLVADLATARTSAETSAAELQEARRERDEAQAAREKNYESCSNALKQLTALREERDKLSAEKEHWREARRQGREEVLSILIREDAEAFAEDYQNSSPMADTGDYIIGWNEEALRALFDIRTLDSLTEQLDAFIWEMIGKGDEVIRHRDALAEALEIAERALVWARGVLWTNLAESLRNASADQWKVFTDAIAHVAAIRGGKQEGES